jgi:hypothetical protein
MRAQRKFIWVGVASVALHFLATWLFTLQGWTHKWAYTVAGVLWFHGDLALRYTGSSKLTTMATMLANSVLWGLCFTAFLVAVARVRRRQV